MEFYYSTFVIGNKVCIIYTQFIGTLKKIIDTTINICQINFWYILNRHCTISNLKKFPYISKLIKNLFVQYEMQIIYQLFIWSHKVILLYNDQQAKLFALYFINLIDAINKYNTTDKMLYFLQRIFYSYLITYQA